jgi:thymidylate synthase
MKLFLKLYYLTDSRIIYYHNYVHKKGIYKMKNYLKILENVLENGKPYKNRTEALRIRVTGAIFEHNMREGFPLLTTKKMNYHAVVGELIGFIRGYSSAVDFRELGCNIWDANANENKEWVNNPNRKGTDDLGRIYGVQWRGWRTPSGNAIDQLANAINLVMTDPGSSRNIVQSFNPAEMEETCLPACHTSFQLIADKRKNTLDLVWTQRSCDVFLGLPFNIASYATLLSAICHVTGYDPNKLVGLLSDVHYYDNQHEAIKIQVQQEPLPLPMIMITNCPSVEKTMVEQLLEFTPDDFKLLNYQSHAALPVKMIV